MTYLERYRDAIKSGKIVAGSEMKKLLDQLVDEMHGGIYRYDTSEFEMRKAFMENLCFQSKAPFYMKKMKLMLWQCAFLETIYSFQKYSDEQNRWIRRFQDVLLLIARKNGKTTLMAADAFTDLRIGKGGQDIVCASNDDNQASLLWSQVEDMRRAIDPRSKWTHKNLQRIENLGNSTKIFKLSSKTQNKDGRNIDKAYFDESHDARDGEIAQACKKSMSVKDEPFFINLTTEGFINDGYLDQKLKYMRAVLNKEIDDDTCLPWLYTQDSEQEVWQDESSWYKSNPSLGTVKKWSYLRQQIEESKFDKATRMHTLCKDFNIKQNNAEAWLKLEDYDYEMQSWDIESFRGAYGVGGVDLSETTDLTCAKILFLRDGKKYVYTHYWIPASKLEQSDDEETGAHYIEWARKGLMTIEDDNEIDVSKVADWYLMLYKKYEIRAVCVGYDQRFAKPFIEKMENYGIEIEMIYQNRHIMSNPMKLVEADLKNRMIEYNKNEIDKWCLGNASMQMDNLGQVMCVKIANNPKKRIDGAVTLIIAYEAYRRHKDELKRLSERR